MTTNPNQGKHHRPLRLASYDYKLPGAYFITLVTNYRQCLFGEISAFEMNLSPIGQIAEQEWLRLPARFPSIELPAHIVMPNHVHGIIQVNEQNPAAEIHQQREQFGQPVAGSLATLIRAFKSAVTLRVRRMRLYRQQEVWQHNYYEHIIRTEQRWNRFMLILQAIQLPGRKMRKILIKSRKGIQSLVVARRCKQSPVFGS